MSELKNLLDLLQKVGNLSTETYELEQLLRYKDAFFATCPVQVGDRVEVSPSLKGWEDSHYNRYMAGATAEVKSIDYYRDCWFAQVHFDVQWSQLYNNKNVKIYTESILHTLRVSDLTKTNKPKLIAMLACKNYKEETSDCKWVGKNTDLVDNRCPVCKTYTSLHILWTFRTI